MVTLLMMSGKTATLGFLEIKVFLNRVYDATISVDDINNKIT